LCKIQSRPRISIGLPVYNGARFIEETLDSLLAQTYEDFELIICDNASNDQTEQICLAYQEKDERVQYYRNATNLGAVKNYKKVLELSSGEYFRWANSDDLFSPVSLARCVEVLDGEPSIVLTYPKTRFIDENGQSIGDCEDDFDLQNEKASERFKLVHEKLGRVNGIYGLVRTDILRKTKLIRNFIGGDIHVMAELSLYGKFWRIPEFLFFRRIHDKAYSSYEDIEKCQEFFDPNTKGRAPFREWHHLMAYFDSVLSAPLNIFEKLDLSIYLFRTGIWNRKKLANELFDGLHYVRSNFFNV
jgi:glycosyltransferase involved in cell wall biosynthesis